MTKIFSYFVENLFSMKGLTKKEEEIMLFFWEKGPLYVKEIQDMYPEPKPHINTISTMVRILEEKGLVGHESVNKSYRYFPLVSGEEFSNSTLKGVIAKYFNNSYIGAVSSLLKDEEVSIEELKELIEQIEQSNPIHRQ